MAWKRHEEGGTGSPDWGWVDSSGIKGMEYIKGVRRGKSDWIWYLGD